MWDERFATPEYIFGTSPAEFVRREGKRLPAGAKILCVADGEGRNSVYLAQAGHDVTAMDGSAVATAKARKLAVERGVDVVFQTADIAGWDWSESEYDAVFAVFIQFASPGLRDAIFSGMVRSLKPGGLLFLHGYTRAQLTYGTGGPLILDQLYTPDLLSESFAGMEVLRLAEYEAELSEGTGHAGRSALIDLVACKPS